VDFWDLTKLLFRRWHVTLPLLVLTLAAVFVVGQTTKPDYKAKTYVSLVPPAGDNAAQRNPWVNTGLNALAKTAMLTVQSSGVNKGLTANGYSGSYTLELAGDFEPIVMVEVVAPTEANATATAREVARLLDQTMTSIQSESRVAQADMITTLPVRVDDVQVSSTKVVRAMIFVGVIGLVVTAAVTVGLDAMLRRRRRGGPPAVEVATRTPRPDPGGGPGSWGQRPTPASPTLSHAAIDGRDPRDKPLSVGGTPGGRDREYLLQLGSDEPTTSTRGLPVEYQATGRPPAEADSHERHERSERPDPRTAPPPDPIDSTIVLPLTGPGAWSNKDRGKRR
jgi:hypothetical protein